MNWVDWVLIALVALVGLAGWHRGLIRGVLDTATWIASLLLAFLFYQPLGYWLHRGIGWSEIWTRPAAFVLIALVSLIGVGWLAGKLSRKMPIWTHRNALNRLLGIAPGLFEGLVSAAIVALLLLLLPLPASVSSSARHSLMANGLAVRAERVAGLFDQVFGGAVSQALTYISLPPDSSERIQLHFTVADPAIRPELEDDMLDLVNNERTGRGLEPLEFDPELRAVARVHSADMFARGYFGHVTPEGITPFDRLREANVSFLIAGENLALAPSLSIAHGGLMASPAHRENILRSQFTRMGIGIMDGGKYGLMITQMFRD